MFITQQSRVYFQTKYSNYSYLTLEALFWFKIVPVTAFTGYSLLFRRKFPVVFPIVWTFAANVVVPNPEKWFFRVQQQKERFMNSFTKFKKYTYTRMTFDQFTHCFDIARVSAIQKKEKINEAIQDPKKREQIKQAVYQTVVKANETLVKANQTLKDKNELSKIKDKLKEDVKEIMRQKIQEMKERLESGKNENTGQTVENKPLSETSQSNINIENKGPQSKSVVSSQTSPQQQSKGQKQVIAVTTQIAQVQIQQPAPKPEQGYKQYALQFFVRYFRGPKFDQDAAILGTYFLMRYSIVGTLRNFGLFI